MKKNNNIAFLIITTVTLAGLSTFSYFQYKKTQRLAENTHRLSTYYAVLSKWLGLKLNKKNVSEFFKSNRIESIAIYGMGELGTLLYDELKNSDVLVKYCIDKEIDDKNLQRYPIISLDELGQAEDVDAIIVTPMHKFNEIYKILSGHCDRVISLWNVFEL